MKYLVLLALIGLATAETTPRPSNLGTGYVYQNQPISGLQQGLNQPLTNQNLNQNLNQPLNQNLPISNVESNLPIQSGNLPLNNQLPLNQGIGQPIPIISGQQTLLPLNQAQPLTFLQPIYVVPSTQHGYNWNMIPQPMLAGRATPAVAPATVAAPVVSTPVTTTPIIAQPQVIHKPIMTTALPLNQNRHFYSQKHYVGGYPYSYGYNYDPYSFGYSGYQYPYYGGSYYPYGGYSGQYGGLSGQYGGYSGQYGGGYYPYSGGIWNQNTNVVSVDPLISSTATTTDPLLSTTPNVH